MAKTVTVPVKTPKGVLEWVIISGEGRPNKKGKLMYKASVVCDPEAADVIAFKKKIDDFWKDNRPKGAKVSDFNTIGYRNHSVSTGKTDEDGDKIFEETGKIEFFFSTGTTWPDGSQKVIKVYNSKGRQVSLGAKKVGNASEGRISGNMALYDVAGNMGVNLYLDSVMITKFVEYVDGTDWSDDVDESDDGWTGEDENEWTGEDESAEEAAPTAGKPRL